MGVCKPSVKRDRYGVTGLGCAGGRSGPATSKAGTVRTWSLPALTPSFPTWSLGGTMVDLLVGHVADRPRPSRLAD